MSPLYPKLDVTNNFVVTAVPSAPAAIEEKECSIDWNRLPEAEEPSWYQVTKTRQVVAKVLGGLGACTAGGTVYTGMWLAASPLVVIGAFASLAVTTVALGVTAVAFYAFSESCLDPKFRVTKRSEAEKLYQEGRLTFGQMQGYGPTVLAGDEVQELLRYDIQKLNFSQFINRHGEEVMGSLSPELLTSLKVRYLTHIGEYEAGSCGLQEVLQRKISQQFAVSMRELASDFISLELYRMYSNGSSYGEFIRRNGKEAISYVVGSNYQNWFINKFFDHVRLEMQGKGAIDAEKCFKEDFGYFGDLVKESVLLSVLVNSYDQFVQNNQSYELFRYKNSLEHLRLLVARAPGEAERLRQSYLEMSYEAMVEAKFAEDRALLVITSADIRAAMEDRFKAMNLTELLQQLMGSSKVYSDGILQNDTKLAGGQLFGRALENHISRTRELANLIDTVPSFIILERKNEYVVQLIASYLQGHAEGYLNNSLNSAYNEIIDSYALPVKKQYQQQMAVIDSICKRDLEGAALRKERAFLEAKVRFGIDRLRSELHQAEMAKNRSEQPLVILRQSMNVNQSEMARIVYSRKFSPAALQQAERALNLARQNENDQLQSHELRQQRGEISRLEASVRDLQSLSELRAKRQEIQSRASLKPVLQREIEEAESALAREVQGIVQAVRAARKNSQLKEVISSKQRELWTIEKDELILEGLTANIALLEAKAIHPDVAVVLQRKRRELAARELAIKAACSVEQREKDVAWHLEQRDLESKYFKMKAREIELKVQFTAAEKQKQIALRTYERANSVFKRAEVQYLNAIENSEYAYRAAVEAAKNKKVTDATACLQVHVSQLVKS